MPPASLALKVTAMCGHPAMSLGNGMHGNAAIWISTQQKPWFKGLASAHGCKGGA